MSHFESSSCVGSVHVPHNELIAVLGLPFDSGSFDDSEEVRPYCIRGHPYLRTVFSKQTKSFWGWVGLGLVAVRLEIQKKYVHPENIVFKVESWFKQFSFGSCEGHYCYETCLNHLRNDIKSYGKISIFSKLKITPEIAPHPLSLVQFFQSHKCVRFPYKYTCKVITPVAFLMRCCFRGHDIWKCK